MYKALCLFLAATCVLNAAVKPENNDYWPPVEVQFENEEMKISKMSLPPEKQTKMHRDDLYRVLVTLKGDKLQIIDKSGSESSFTLESGKSYYLSPDSPGSMHATVNKSNEPIEIMVIEFKE